MQKTVASILSLILILSLLPGCINQPTDEAMGNQPPTAKAEVNPPQGNSPLTVSFKGVGYDPDGYVTRYQWEFIDPQSMEEKFFLQQNFTYTFLYNGSGYHPNATIEVMLTVWDDDGATGNCSVDVTIHGTGYIIRPEADTYVNSKKPDENYGTREYIIVTKVNTTDVTIGYLRFNLTTLPSKNVKKATLHLQVNNIDSETTIGVYYCSDVSWGETTITWNNAPPFSQKITETRVNYTRDYSWDVTSEVQNVSKSGGFTLVLKAEDIRGHHEVGFLSNVLKHGPVLYIHLR